MNFIFQALPALTCRSAVFLLSTTFLATIVSTAKAQMTNSSAPGVVEARAGSIVIESSLIRLKPILPASEFIGGLAEPRSSSLFFEEGQERLEQEIKLLMEQELIDSQTLLQIEIEEGEGRFGEEIREIN